MLNIETQRPPEESRKTVTVEQSESGEYVESLRNRSKWFVSGLWPFNRISFECPGCGRWLAVKITYSDRVASCPHCTLDLKTPDVEGARPARLIAKADGHAATRARGLPSRRADVVKSGQQQLVPLRVDPNEEGEWGGASAQGARVPVRLVKSYQSLVPWVVVGAVVATAVGIFLTIALSGVSMRAAASGDDPEVLSTSSSSSGSVSKIPLWVVFDALETAETPEEVLALTRDRERVEPKLLAFYASNPHIALPHRLERNGDQMKLVMVDGKTFGRFNGRCDGKPVKFAFESTKYGWRLDWESMVGYSTGEWGDFLTARPSGEHTFRLIAAVEREGGGSQFDGERYIGLKLVDRYGAAEGVAVLEREGEMAAKLGKFLSQPVGDRVPTTWLTLDLSWGDGVELPEVVGLRSTSWLVP